MSEHRARSLRSAGGRAAQHENDAASFTASGGRWYDVKMKYLLLFSGLLSLPLYLTGCGSLGCTEIGCADQLTVTLKGLASTHAAQLPLSINLAVDGKSLLDAKLEGSTCTGCDLGSNGSVTLQAFPGFQDENAHTVHVIVKGKDGTTLFDDGKDLSITSSQPNGSGCEPTCYQPAAVSFTP